MMIFDGAPSTASVIRIHHAESVFGVPPD